MSSISNNPVGNRQVNNSPGGVSGNPGAKTEPERPPAFSTENGEKTFSTWEYDSDSKIWKAKDQWSFSETNKLSTTSFKEMVSAGLGEELLSYFQAAGTEFQNYVESSLLDQKSLFYEQGYLPVQYGDKIVLASGAGYAENLASALNLNSGEVKFSTKSENGLQAGINIKIDGKWHNATSPLTSAVFDTLSDQEQASLVESVRAGLIPENFISQDMLNPGTTYSRLLEEMSVPGSASTWTPQPDEIELPSPKITFVYTSSGNAAEILRQSGMMANADAWAMVLMMVSSDVQSTLTEALTQSFKLNQQLDDLLFNKTLSLNNRLFDTIRQNNLEFQRLQASRPVKRTASERIGSFFDKLFSGDIGGAFCEAVTLLYDVTIGLVVSAITVALSKAATAVAKLFDTTEGKKATTTGQQFLQNLHAFFESSATSALSKLRLEDQKTGTLDFMSEEEEQAIKNRFNVISAEEAAYLNYTDIASLGSLINREAREANENMTTATNWTTGLSAAIGGYFASQFLYMFLAPLGVAGLGLGVLAGIFLASGAVSKYQQNISQLDTSTFAAESSYRQAQFNHVTAMTSAMVEQLSASRDAIADETSQFSQELANSMEFLASMEEFLGQILEQVGNLGRGAARSL